MRQTWLTRKPSDSAFTVTGASTLALCLGSLIYLWGIGGIDRWMAASYESAIEHRQYWRLWTTLFAHADLGHLAANTLLFFILGYFLNGYFGSLVFPGFAFAFGGLVNLAILPTYPTQVEVIGASGVVYWMGGTWLILFFFLSRQKNFSQRVLRTLGVGILIFMPAETFEPKTSYRAHFVGFGFGILFGVWHYVRNRQRFQEAEIREWIVEDSDPGDDLPGPDGLQTGNPDKSN